MNETKSACVAAAAALSQLKAKQCKPVPSGWFDSEQFGHYLNMGKESTRRRILRLKKAGLLEEKNWPCLDDQERIYHKRIYRNI